MKVKLKDVYYCDYCGKHTLTKLSMANHESHCTLNPNRICRVCNNKDEKCPMCKFSELQLKRKTGEIKYIIYDLQDEMKKYWAKKYNDAEEVY